MSGAAFALIGLFTAISVAAGLLAARLAGPWRWWSPILPFLAAFGALYLVGHRLGWNAGPNVSLFGFRVALLLDLTVALVSAVVAAWVQAGLLRLLEPQQRSAGRDRHA